jgi:apolipoprotein N-acyltransferase
MENSIVNRSAFQVVFFGILSGLCLGIPLLYPQAVCLQLMALLPILCLRKRMLLAGIAMGITYCLPLFLHLHMPIYLTASLGLFTIALLASWAGLAQRYMQSPSFFGCFAIGSAFVLVDWINIQLPGIWGSAQSFVRPWSEFPSSISFVSISGILGISFFLGTSQALLAKILCFPEHRRRFAVGLSAFLALFAFLTLFSKPGVETSSLKVAAIGWTSNDTKSSIGYIQSKYESKKLFEEPIRLAAKKGAKFLVAPEMSFLLSEKSYAKWLTKLEKLAKRYQIALCVGYIDKSTNTNRLVFIDPKAGAQTDYVKTHILFTLESWEKGDGVLATYELDGVSIGGLICNDDNFTALTRGHGRKGTSVLAIPTNDWKTVSYLHMQSSRFRALESHLALIRSTKGGVTAVISANGEILAQKDHFVEGPGFILCDLAILKQRSLYNYLGDWIGYLSLLILFLSVFLQGSIPKELE